MKSPPTSFISKRLFVGLAIAAMVGTVEFVMMDFYFADSTPSVYEIVENENSILTCRKQDRDWVVSADVLLLFPDAKNEEPVHLQTQMERSGSKIRCQVSSEDTQSYHYNYIVMADDNMLAILRTNEYRSPTPPFPPLTISIDQKKNRMIRDRLTFDARFLGLNIESFLEQNEADADEFLMGRYLTDSNVKGISFRRELWYEGSKDVEVGYDVDSDFFGRYILSPAQGMSIVYYECRFDFQRGFVKSKNKLWKESGIWFPEHILTETFKNGLLQMKCETVVRNLEVGTLINPDRFTLASMNIPEGTTVLELGTARRNKDLYWDGEEVKEGVWHRK